MSPFEHGEVFVLDDGGEVSEKCLLSLCFSLGLATKEVDGTPTNAFSLW